MTRRGFSLIEVMVACLIIGIAAAPMIGVLSSSNRTSKASVFEILAVQYAEELSEQLLRLSQRLKAMRDVTTKDIKTLLEDPSVATALAPTAVAAAGPTVVPIPGTQIVLFCSPLNPNFIARVLRVDALSNAGKLVLKTGNFWKVTIGLAWRMSANDPQIHNASFSVILREDP